jgi:amino acid adenylation domain-containing protein
VRIDLIFDASRLDLAHMDELLAQYERLLQRAAADQAGPVAGHPLTGAGDDRGRVAVPVPYLRALTEPVAAAARREPRRRAVAGPSGELSYGQLGAWAGRIAAWLRGAGAGPGDVVAVYAHRDPSLVAALLGILDAGAAFCVLDPAYPVSRLADQVRVARPAVLLGLAAAGPPPAELTRLVPLTHEVAAAPVTGPPLTGTPGDRLAYVAFTSGSTGAPKAVRGDHAPVAHFIEHYADVFGLGGSDRFALLAGLSHDPLLRDVFAPLQVGASLHIPPPSLLRDPEALLGWLAAERITVAHVTPPLIRLLASASASSGEAGELPGLRLVVSGGDVLREADVAAVRDLAPGATVVNAYGATETPQVMAWQLIPPELACAPTADVVPVGTAIDGVDLQVVRADGGPAAVGELGRIVLRTPYLSREYLAAREFRTGDLGRLRPDGRVALAGRSDRQVKISGFRVDPGSVETLVRALPYIDDCVTVPHADPDGETRLVAYAVPTPGAVLSIRRLRRDLRARAPEHMLPAGPIRPRLRPRRWST